MPCLKAYQLLFRKTSSIYRQVSSIKSRKAPKSILAHGVKRTKIRGF